MGDTEERGAPAVRPCGFLSGEEGMLSPNAFLRQLAAEPPFRMFSKRILSWLPCSVETRARWDLSPRPHYLVGLLFAAGRAGAEGVPAICAIEFGVAGGSGLMALQDEAESVERATGVAISVYGFDAGPEGMPGFCGDYRDHPDLWRPGDYPMDAEALREELKPRTTVVLGDIRETIQSFRQDFDPKPIGFMAIDVDLYSSSAAALTVLDLCPILRQVAIYCDDIDFELCHQWAGERLAIDEFNEKHPHKKIDRWHGLRYGRPFPERAWINRMFICHDLEAISQCTLDRRPRHLPL
jgi:hypothetical protein